MHECKANVTYLPGPRGLGFHVAVGGEGFSDYCCALGFVFSALVAKPKYNALPTLISYFSLSGFTLFVGTQPYHWLISACNAIITPVETCLLQTAFSVTKQKWPNDRAMQYDRSQEPSSVYHMHTQIQTPKHPLLDCGSGQQQAVVSMENR